MIEMSLAAVTVRLVAPVTAPAVALICAVPAPAPVASPDTDTEATPAFDDAHATELVRSTVDPSEYVPVAWNCWVVPLAIDGFAGVMAIDVNAGAPTVRVVLPVIPAVVALIVEVPCATAVASPPAVTDATPVLDETHVAEKVRFCVLPSEYVPVAVNCCVAPLAIDGFAGATAIDTRVAVPTASVVLPVTPVKTALISAVPRPTPVANPALLTVATPVFEELQATEVVRFFVVPSE